MFRKNIAVLGGGNSSEYDVSIESARNVSNWIDSKRFNVYIVQITGAQWTVCLEGGRTVDVDKNDFSIKENGSKIKFDCAVIAIHGTPGEDGILQSYFELVGVPYTTCDVFVSALTFKKNACKAFLKDYGVGMAKGVTIYGNQEIDFDAIEKEIGFPCFVKPNASGSSCGVSIAKNKTELKTGIEYAATESDDVLIEAALVGTEISHAVAVINGVEVTFPITEIVTASSFFDYHAKYDGDKSEEITPARLSDDLTRKCQNVSMSIYKALHCRGIVRIDYIIQNDEPYFLEVNTVPGMSSNSIVPKQIHAMGRTVTEFYSMMIDEAIARGVKNMLGATCCTDVFQKVSVG